MNRRLRLLAAMLSIGILAPGILVSCASDPATPLPGAAAEATPDVSATITAQVQRAGPGTPTPTAVPAGARAAALEFAASHADISADWDQFHADYDNWRLGLSACTAGSFRASLQGFAGRFAGVTAAARSLPRSTAVRELSDALIEAAELEEAALRNLRDTWRPADTSIREVVVEGDSENDSEEAGVSQVQAPVSGFELVDQARAVSSALRQDVADSLTDRAANTSEASVASINEFAAGFNAIDAAWDDFHRRYDSFRSETRRTASGETVSQLGLLINRFHDIVTDIRQLPTIASTRPAAEALVQAAEQEDLALRRLRDTLQLIVDPVAGAIDESLTSNSVQDPSSAGGESAEQEPETPAPTLFHAFDAQLVEANSERLEAQRLLEEVLEDISDNTQVEVQDFAGSYGRLLEDWNSFHAEYDEWRNTGGGCDQSEATAALGQLSASFGKISRAVRGLPAATVLRPLAEILVEAAEREERALRELRNTWRPNDTGVYRDFDLQRSTAGKLRRQVKTGLQELLEDYGISSLK